MPQPDPAACLQARRSTPARQLGDPGPDDATLLAMLAAAVRVPDHGKRVPFRFIRVAGEARHALGERLVARSLERDPSASDAVLEKARTRFSHAPLVLVVVAETGPDEKIPWTERFSTASCVCFALLQAAQSFGFGAQWLTGWAAYDDGIRATLGIRPDERITGFIHLGTPRLEAPERERPEPSRLLSDWTEARG